MTNRYIDFRERSKNSGVNLAELVSMINKIKDISNTEIFAKPNRKQNYDGQLFIKGQDYQFIEVLSMITQNGYSVIKDGIIKEKIK